MSHATDMIKYKREMKKMHKLHGINFEKCPACFGSGLLHGKDVTKKTRFAECPKCGGSGYKNG